MCLTVQYLNNDDSEDLIIFTNLLALCLWLGYVLDGRFRTVTRFDACRWWLNIVPISFAQLHTSKLDVANVSADLDPLYGEKHPIRSNFLRTDVLLRRARISQHWSPVLRAGWSGTGSNAFSAVHGSLHGVADFSKNVHLEMILPVSQSLKMWLPFKIVRLY